VSEEDELVDLRKGLEMSDEALSDLKKRMNRWWEETIDETSKEEWQEAWQEAWQEYVKSDAPDLIWVPLDVDVDAILGKVFGPTPGAEGLKLIADEAEDEAQTRTS
jgi:hypothetical protein